MNALTIQPSRLPVAPAIVKEFDIQPAEWRVLVEQIFPAAKSVESVMMALAYCRKRNLDIFKKPVHIVPMWSSEKRQYVETVWPGISEIRTTASRTGQYAGIDEVQFGPELQREFTGSVKEGGNWKDVKKTVKFPEWARVTVYRLVQGRKSAFHAKIYWIENYATTGKGDLPNEMWTKRAYGQLDKCVEAAALRKAFPEELGNIYSAEEMEGRVIEHDASTEPSSPVPSPPPPPSPPSPGKSKPAEQVIEHEPVNTGHSVGPEFDATSYLENLEMALAGANDAEMINEVLSEFDVEGMTADDPELSDVIGKMRAKREKEIGADY